MHLHGIQPSEVNLVMDIQYEILKILPTVGGIVHGTGSGPNEASSRENAAAAAVGELRRRFPTLA